MLAPPNVYFSGDYTITLWMNWRSTPDYSNIIDFGNGPFGDFSTKMNKQLKILTILLIGHRLKLLLKQTFGILLLLFRVAHK